MSSTPIVLLHGSYHQPAHYDELAGRLADLGCSVTVPDIGMLPLPESTALVQDIVAEAASPPVIVGHSFGGAVAGALHGVRQIVFLSGWVLDVGETATLLNVSETTVLREWRAARAWLGTQLGTR